MKTGLPAIAMTIAMTIAWGVTTLPGVTIAVASGITLTAAWFVVKLFGAR